MQSELYTAAQGLIARQYQLDNVTNNIANAATDGFREVSAFYRSFNESLQNGPANPLNNAANNQPVVAGVFAHSRQGAIKATGNSLDLAIQGDGFFRLETPNGQRYTRAGSFTMDATGRLTNHNGYAVMDVNNQPIRLATNATDTEISENGTVFQDGNAVARVKVVTFADKELFTPEEDVLLVHQNPNAVEQPAEGRILGGHLETSNVNIAKQMVDMISLQRAYDANVRTIRAIDTDLNQAAIRGFGPR